MHDHQVVQQSKSDWVDFSLLLLLKFYSESSEVKHYNKLNYKNINFYNKNFNFNENLWLS